MLNTTFVSLCLIVIISTTSCTFFNAKKEKNEVKINEHIVENNSAAKIAAVKTSEKIQETKINIENTNFIGARLSIYGAETANSITSEFLRRNENILGKPLQPQEPTINNLLSTNPTIRLAEEKKQNLKENDEIKLRAENEKLRRELEEYGEKYEAERNRSIVKRIWSWSISTLGITGILLLIIFFPACIPIFTQILAKIVSLIPSLAHGLGIVSSKIVKNTSLAIGTLRDNLKKEKELGQKTYNSTQVLEMLDRELKIALDSDDKKIIENFRNKLNV